MEYLNIAVVSPDEAYNRTLCMSLLHSCRQLEVTAYTSRQFVLAWSEYQGSGAWVLMFKHLHENCIKRNITRIIMNPQLEENYKVQSLFGEYKTIPFMRRRAYKKHIG